MSYSQLSDNQSVKAFLPFVNLQKTYLQTLNSLFFHYNLQFNINSRIMQIINSFILPQCKSPSQTSIGLLEQLLQDAQLSMSEAEIMSYQEQWKILGKKLSTNDKLLYLKQQNCRTLLIQLIKEGAIKQFNSSYLNRAKIDSQYIRYLKLLGSHFFIEVIRIVSKLKIIHKHFYNALQVQAGEDHIKLKILQILKLCNEKKRSVNNNKDKFICIVEEESDRKEVTIQLGKMLRQAWKRDKSKSQLDQKPQFEQQQFEADPLIEMQDLTSTKQIAKPHLTRLGQNSEILKDLQFTDPYLDFGLLQPHESSRDQLDFYLY